MGIENVENLFNDDSEDKFTITDSTIPPLDYNSSNDTTVVFKCNPDESLGQEKKIMTKIGDIQIDSDKSEWVIIGITHTGVSRVRRNSLAHKIHAQDSPEIAKSLSKE